MNELEEKIRQSKAIDILLNHLQDNNLLEDVIKHLTISKENGEVINKLSFYQDKNGKLLSNYEVNLNNLDKSKLEKMIIYRYEELSKLYFDNNLVEENTIFARVKPDQKKMLISALRKNGHVVAMTGDGVNDVLALKEADCGVAMSDGADAARNVSELVLLDSNFDSMPKIVKEGRRTINNVERSATLFLSKTIYASLLALLFLFINHTYPFIPIQMTLINSLTIGIPAFILALEPNKLRVKGKFFINVVSKAIPSGITTVVNILILVLVASLLKIPGAQTSTCAVIITAYTALLLIYRISKPLNLLRKSLLLILSIIFLLALVTPIGRSIFSLEILTPNSLLILLPLMYISTRLFKLLSNLLNMVIERKRSWFM